MTPHQTKQSNHRLVRLEMQVLLFHSFCAVQLLSVMNSLYCISVLSDCVSHDGVIIITYFMKMWFGIFRKHAQPQNTVSWRVLMVLGFCQLTSFVLRSFLNAAFFKHDRIPIIRLTLWISLLCLLSPFLYSGKIPVKEEWKGRKDR